MDPSTLWNNYIKYIGAGAVATGGILYDQGLAQRDHEENPEQTSTECNQRNFNQGRAGDTTLGRPHEQRREGRNRLMVRFAVRN